MRGRRTIVMIALSAIAATWLCTAPVGAQDVDDDHADESSESTPSTSVPEGIGLDEGIFVTGAVVIPPDGEEPRVMDEYQAATFAQSWLGAAFFSGPDAAREPPADLPVYRVDIAGTWAGSPGNVTVYYASDGTTPYLAFPGLTVWTDPEAVPPPSQWFIPPDRVIDAFNGEAELIDTGGITNATIVPGADEQAAGDERGTGEGASAWTPWLVGIAIALLVTAAGVVWRRRRRLEPSSSAPTSP